MKRAVLSAVFLAAVVSLAGCPIYSHDDDGCRRDKDCENGYLCDDSSGSCYLSGAESERCVRPADCGVNQTCTAAGRCVSGDCSFSSCVAGYRCDASSGIWQCVSGTSDAENGGAGGSASGAAGAESSPAEAGAGGDTAGAGGG